MLVFHGEGSVLSSVWGSESDHWLSPLSTNPSQGLIDVKDQMMGVESEIRLVPYEPRVRVFLLPVSLPIPGPSQSHSIPVLRSKNAGWTEEHLSPSHSIIIHRSFFRWYF